MLSSKAPEAFDLIAPSIFRIECRTSEFCAAATGFAIARLTKSERLVLATARHVVECAQFRDAHWLVQQFDRNGKPSREISFRSVAGDSHAHVHKKMDLGLLVLDRGEPPFASATEPVARFMDERLGVTPGTRVGWAGYPAIAHDLLGHPQLCYCEGVVSAMIDRDDRRLYLVDGHNTFGISGGPVWHWSRDRDQVEVVGVVSGYRTTPIFDDHTGESRLDGSGRLSDSLPGFCVFEPLESFRAFFDSWHRHWESER